MGNAESAAASIANIVAGIKRAQEDKENRLYELVDYKGGGELLQWSKFAISSGDYSLLDGLIEMKVTPFLYGGGKAKLVPIAQLVKIRNKERNATLGALSRKRGKGKSGPDILEGLDQEAMQGDMRKALKFLDGGGQKGARGGSTYRELTWDIEARGAYGETLLHLCLLHGTAMHNEVARRLLEAFPKLVNDIYLSEAYYGQSALHQAIVNEDPSMVRFLLAKGADVHQRCVGAVFCPDDQKATRTDSLEYEWVDVNPKTNYACRTYWGEYPLCYAACTRQFDCFRLLRANKADPNMRDTNGNTVLHLMVIHGHADMFDLAHRLGAKLHVANNQNLTPLTLAAKLAKKKMFNHVLMIERDVLWTYGDVLCSAYPLQYIDTIEEGTGELNKLSALSLIVYGESNDHLDLLDGLVEDILEQKWHSFGERKLMQQFIQFLLYFACVFMSFLYRVYMPDGYLEGVPSNSAANVSTIGVITANTSTGTEAMHLLDNVTFVPFGLDNGTDHIRNILDHWKRDVQCHLMRVNSNDDIVRMVFETLTILGAGWYSTASLIHMKRIGWKFFLRSLAAFPAKMAFNLSFFIILLLLPLRFFCWIDAEHILSVVAVLLTSIHFLFFCRAIKLVGPFVLMFYKMLVGDVLRFLLIYVIFVIGFSQSYYVIFLGCHRGMDVSGVRNETVIVAKKSADPFESILHMFMMSIGEFQEYFKALATCRLAALGKVLFVIYELSVFVMLINMLIASMARTYDEISQTEKEWKRQWAKVILLLEQTLTPAERLSALIKYSRPIGTDKTKRAFVVRARIDAEEKEAKVKQREGDRRAFVEEKRILYKRRLLGYPIGSEMNPIPASVRDMMMGSSTNF